MNCARGLARITWRFTAKPGGKREREEEEKEWEQRQRKVGEASQHGLKAHYESIIITAENDRVH